MSPFTIHEAAAKKQHAINIMRPQEAVPADLPENFGGTMGQGLPVMQIPHMEFPRVLYMHPNEPTKIVLHRNEKHEVVHEELVQTEHLTMTVNSEEELKKALKDGWVREPYIPEPLPKTDAGLYGPRKQKQAQAS
jgi:hypothetical protein